MIFGLKRFEDGTPKAKPLNAQAAPWSPKCTKTISRLKEITNREPLADDKERKRPKIDDSNKELATHNEFKSTKFRTTKYKYDENVGSPTSSLALPAFCTPPQRDEGCTLFAGHRATATVDKSLSFLDHASLPKIYSQIKHKTRQLLELEEKGHPGR